VKITKATSVKDIACYTRHYSNEGVLVAVKLKYANRVYVADQAAFEKRREYLFSKMSESRCLTNRELDTCYAARGATIIPIADYTGGFELPIVLIERELDFDEILWVGDVK
jgi:hypothetical protein